MRKKTRRYKLQPSFTISEEGISLYKLLRDDANFPSELMEKYARDVRELLNAKLDNLTVTYKVPEKDIQRIKQLIAEVEKVAETKC